MSKMTNAQKKHAFSLFLKIVSKFDGGQKELSSIMGISGGSMTAWKMPDEYKNKRGRGVIPAERVNDYFGKGKGLVSIARSLDIDCDLNDFRPDIWTEHHTYEALTASQ